jgi:betaine-aldehyde dehydrogenase
MIISKGRMKNMRNQHYIGGRWIDGSSGQRLPVINPADGVAFHDVQAGSDRDASSAVESAAEAFRTWRRTSGRERASYLRAIARRITERREELARLEVLDNGKPLPEALWDIDDAAGCFDYYAELAEGLDDRQGQALEVPDARFRSKVRYEPVGVAALIVPWNYPLLMASWKVAPALAAGATMVLKPSELTPLTALELASIAEEIGLPAGVLNVVTGYGPDVGGPLSRHPLVRKVAFTGSVPTGIQVMSSAAQDIKTVSLELGGKSPLIVFADSDIESAVEWIMFGIFWNQGQVCSATSRLLVEDAIAPRLLERLAHEASQIKIGNGLEPGTLLGPLVSENQHSKVAQAVSRAEGDGAKVLTGGGRPRELGQGYFFQPTVLVDVPVESPAWREEIFGPVLSVRTFDREGDAIALANDSRYGLAAAVMSTDLERCERIAAELEAGIVWINCSQPTFTQAPWGGMKQSGIGRELGIWGLENYLEVKQITSYTSADRWGWYIKPQG